MSLHPQQLGAIPSETIRVAQLAFPKGNIYLKMRDELGVFYSDNDFNSLFSQKGQPAFCPWRLALITIMQYVEGLTDRQAADAVRGRIDWKYALGLELTDSGFDFSLLSEFRARLIKGGLEQQLFAQMLGGFKKKELLKSPQKQRTDSTHILAAIRVLTRLEKIGETLRYALNSIAAVAPNWLREIVPDEEWYSRYGQRFQENRFPTSKKERSEIAVMMGMDGNYLLDLIWSNSGLEWLRHLESVEILRQVWIQQFFVDNGILKLREYSNCTPEAILINSPYDSDARMGNKRTSKWTGYKVHLSETCDEDSPHLITYVETTLTRVLPFRQAIASSQNLRF
ncbi:MAG: transposase [Xenococcaceae cyanobacterium]